MKDFIQTYLKYTVLIGTLPLSHYTMANSQILENQNVTIKTLQPNEDIISLHHNAPLTTKISLVKNRELAPTLEEKTNHNNLNNDIDIQTFIKNKIREAEERVKARSINLFTQELSKEFRSNVLPDIFEVSEEEEVIVALNKPSLSLPFSIKKAIYIDTPMSLSVWEDNNKYWSTLNRLLLRVEKNASYPSSMSLLISNNIKGEADTSG